MTSPWVNIATGALGLTFAPFRILALPLSLGYLMTAEAAMKVLLGLTFTFLYRVLESRLRGQQRRADRLAVVALFHVRDRPGADEEDVRDVDLDIVALIPVRGDVERHEDLLAFEDRQQGLVHPFAADVARTRAAGATDDLVDLIDEDDAILRGADIRLYANGTSRIFASVRARYVFPEPDGSIINMFDLRIETSPPNFRYSMRLRWLYAAMARTSFACRCPMTY